MENTTKGRYWTFLVFEDNIKQNPKWLKKLLDTHLRFCISPYHDKDLWSELDLQKHPDRVDEIEIGKPKKAHYHVLIHCDDNTTFKTMKELTESLGLPIPLKVIAPDGLYRYFCHQDNPEKHQYDINDIRHYNGSEPSDYLMEISRLKKLNIITELTAFITGKMFIHYADIYIGISQSFPDPNYRSVFLQYTSYFKEVFKDNLANRNSSIMAKARKTV